jgi:hypothetical protein
MTKTLTLIVAAAFVVGILTTGTLVSAAPPEDNPGEPFDGVLEKLDEILAAIGAIDLSDLSMIKDDVSDIKTETDKIQMVKDDVSDIKTETDKIQMVKDDVTFTKNLIGDVSTIKYTNVENEPIDGSFQVRTICDSDFIVHSILVTASDPDGDADIVYNNVRILANNGFTAAPFGWGVNHVDFDPTAGISSLGGYELLSQMQVRQPVGASGDGSIDFFGTVQASSDTSDDTIRVGSVIETANTATCSIVVIP